MINDLYIDDILENFGKKKKKKKKDKKKKKEELVNVISVSEDTPLEEVKEAIECVTETLTPEEINKVDEIEVRDSSEDEKPKVVIKNETPKKKPQRKQAAKPKVEKPTEVIEELKVEEAIKPKSTRGRKKKSEMQEILNIYI